MPILALLFKDNLAWKICSKMPLFGFHQIDWREIRKANAEKKRKHDEIVRAWKAGELTWNEYIRQEKKYRT